MIASVLTFAVLAFINLKMALILLVCVPLIPVSIIAVQKIAKKILGHYMDKYANLADNYLENLQGLTTLKIFLLCLILKKMKKKGNAIFCFPTIKFLK